MKKLVVSALMALTCGVLFAEDSWFYWMISDTDPITDYSGNPVTDLSGYTAKVKVDGDYMYLYYAPDAGTIGDHVVATEAYGYGLDMIAAVDSSATSFMVELWNSDCSSLEFTSETLTGNIAQYLSSMKGMSTPAASYAFHNFTAVPEPTSGLLLLLGVAGLALRRKNKKA